ncbi:DUF4127 family protein [Bacillus paranthracis]|uniref:DUF4127 family protein n=1 Tax=Bacillus paranthracis TaxID=2026186 RepID=UPI0022E13F47|nr:DUF4127 family protein [Bacillus paranthracis]
MKPQVVFYGLDNRPVNTSFVAKVAQIGSNFELIVAPKLKGADLINWIKNNTTNLKEFVVSIDGLAYGGLIESRIYSDINPLYSVMRDTFEGFKEAYPNVTTTAFNSILRLATNVMSSSELPLYNNIREWAIKKYELNYMDGNDKQALATRVLQLESQIGATALSTYVKTRERNFKINQQALAFTEFGSIDKLVYFSDDASLYGLHRLDRDKLMSEVSSNSMLWNKVSFCSGIDEASVLLTGALQQKYGGHSPKVYIHYTNPTAEKNWAGEFEDRKLHDNILTHIAAAGCQLAVSESDADIIIYPHNPYSVDSQIITHLNTNENYRKAVVLVPSGYQSFVGMLRRNVPIHRLLSFCMWGTVGNQIGIGLGHGIARFVGLRTARYNGSEVQATKAHVEFLLQRFIEDSTYGKVKGTYVSPYVDSIGGDFLNLGSKTAQVERYTETYLRPRAIALYDEKFFNKDVLSDIDGTKYYPTNITLPAINLPWKRLFEIGVNPTVDISYSVPFISDFTDVTPSNQPYAYDHIMKLKRLGIFDGGGANSFYPNNTMIRSHFAKTICSVFKLYSMTNVPNPGFTDVPTSHPFYKEIALVKHLGIMKGNSATTFNPDGELDRASVGNVIANVFTFMSLAGKTPSYFDDTKGISWIEKEADVLAYVGVASTTPERMYYPSMKANRAMVATFLSRALSCIELKDSEGII